MISICPPSFPRGPSYGYKGKVVLPFEENGSSKIGVRFDKQIPDGNDLGGLCEEDHGFFCACELFSCSYCCDILFCVLVAFYVRQ